MLMLRGHCVNKRMLTKQNVGMKDETLRGLRATKDAVKHAGGITNIAVSLDMIKAAEKSRSYYAEYLRKEKKKKEEKEKEKEKENEKEKEKSEERKRKHEERTAEESTLYAKLQEYRKREEAVDGKLKKASKTINEGNAISSDGLKACDMMKIEEGHALTELVGKWQKEAFAELDEIKCEMKKIETELFKDSQETKS